MKELISEADIVNAVNLHKYRMEIAAKALMKIFGLDKLNDLYRQLGDKSGIEFIEAAFAELDIEIEVSDTDLANIPKQGKFITVANHPYGALDGLILLYIIGKARPDFKVLANFLLKEIEPISDFFIAVNPFENIEDRSSISGLKQALQHLRDESCMGIFPAGEVSSYQTHSRKITDREWNSSAVKFIRKQQIPILPIYFSGHNSLFFHLLGVVNPKLRTAVLPKEMFKKKGQKIKVRIGKPISPRDQQGFENDADYGRYLRAKTYALGSSLEVKKFYLPKFKIRPKKGSSEIEEIIPPVSKELLVQEIAALGEKNRVAAQMEFEVYIAYANQIPNALNEIGRLRETTFRAVGEGTNLAMDVDEYDLYYHQLILWDKEAQEIAGGYRIGKGNDILSKFGIGGFYTHSLFKMGRNFKPILEQTIELGRSYVVQEYQGKRLPLFLLWKGIMHFLVSNEAYRYILGPVSISNEYSDVTKQLMVSFIKEHYYDHELAKQIKPCKPFKVNLKQDELKELLQSAGNDLKSLDKIIADVDPQLPTAPILLKKYINQNAKIIGFNVDPLFNNALDGLMILDLHDLPESSIENLKEDLAKDA